MSHSSDLKQVFKPQVPNFLKENRTPFELHVLDKISVTEQQNEVIIDTLADVRVQTTITNGRVKEHDGKIVALEEFVRNAKWRNRMIIAAVTIAGVVIGPVFTALISVLVERWFGK